MKNTFKILAVLFGAFLIFSCDASSDKEEYAEIIIEKVDQFKSENDRLPNDVREIGLTEMEDSPAFYEKTSDSTYQVWYGLSLGESKIFNSQTQEWTTGG